VFGGSAGVSSIFRAHFLPPLCVYLTIAGVPELIEAGLTGLPDSRIAVQSQHYFFAVVYQRKSLCSRIKSLDLSFDDLRFFDKDRRLLGLPAATQSASEPKSVYKKARQ